MSKDSRTVHILLGCGAKSVAKTVLLPATPMCTKRILKFLKNSKRKGQTYLGKIGSLSISVVSTGIGCPSAAIVLEALHSADVRNAIRVDLVGSLRDNINIGDIIIADSAFKGDGTTPYYMEGEKVEADSELTSVLIKKAKECEKNVHVGSIWTTDILFRQTPELYRRAVEKGCI
ncbi:MAG: hypothetical protein QXO71_12785, partial [Candidatus Jordarchaeaceae archaeon]